MGNLADLKHLEALREHIFDGLLKRVCIMSLAIVLLWLSICVLSLGTYTLPLMVRWLLAATVLLLLALTWVMTTLWFMLKLRLLKSQVKAGFKIIKSFY